MNDQAWIRRLKEQLPGWFVYTSSIGREKKWRAVPAPAGTTLEQARDMPRHTYNETPAGLRAAAQVRYGWDDYCESCGVLARECGHRQPEREKNTP
jgi:hypothetical protein